MALQSLRRRPLRPVAVNHNRRMHARWLSFVTWALLAASLAYWSLVLMSRGPQGPAMTHSAVSGGATADWTRLFASLEPVAGPVESASSRYQLLGVVAPSTAGHPGEGVALIAVSGGPPKTARVGQIVDGDLLLMEVTRREIGLGRDGVVSIRVSMAPGAADLMAPPGGAPMSGAPQQLPIGGGMPPMNMSAGPGGPGGVVSPLAVGGALPGMPPPQAQQQDGEIR
ncbi:hypothetical protein [Roseateles amylovorans]|uniref:Type II secretion system protein GspC N-terminal domain-containing protein n=1 Tax=Roseateles amylovorans TaxID=2978473 RepID=A0ABY6B323_9BURK|nr:hypothetical protein [Roseateles amylovorans]UXH79323.1 hypothetical protein N4261_05145 [Roseateles amylovorans]